MEKGFSPPLLSEKALNPLNLKTNMKSVFKALFAVMIASIVVTSIPSCKSQEDCGAYQGSGKSTRSHKHR